MVAGGSGGGGGRKEAGGSVGDGVGVGCGGGVAGVVVGVVGWVCIIIIQVAYDDADDLKKRCAPCLAFWRAEEIGKQLANVSTDP